MRLEARYRFESDAIAAAALKVPPSHSHIALMLKNRQFIIMYHHLNALRNDKTMFCFPISSKSLALSMAK